MRREYRIGDVYVLLGRMDVVDVVNQWWPRGISVNGRTDRRVDLMALMGIDAMFTPFFFSQLVFDIVLYIQFLFIPFYLCGTVLYRILFYHFVTHIICCGIRTSC